MTFDELYIGSKEDHRGLAIFGDRYDPPSRFENGEWYCVARYAPEKDSDGQAVEIDECRMPARFYRLRALEGHNSCGERINPFALSTGSGDERGSLLVALAQEIVAGMVALDPQEEAA